jgi:hypothetical protein
MADIQVIKLKVRRGLNSQRKLVILDEGELGYTIDTQRLYVGTGTLSGGIPAAPKIHGILTNFADVSGIQAEIGDLVYADNLLYQYNNLGTWQFIGSQIDNGTIVYDVDNQLSVGLSSINSAYLNQSQLSSNSVGFDSGRFVVNYETTQFTISGSKFALNSSAIKPIHIDSSTVSRGLTGGAGSALSAYVDGVSIGYNALNQLAVIGTPISAVSYNSLLCGFEVNPSTNQVSTLVRGVDPNYLALSSGIVTFSSGANILSASQAELGASIVDNGFVREVVSSIYDILTCDFPSATAYNGSPDQVATGFVSNNNATKFEAISANTFDGSSITVYLSSAGFVVFEGNSSGVGLSARNNPNHIPGRFAIPVFAF